jgi:hypothetical protein
MSEPNLREEAIDEAINRWDEAHAIGYREGHRAARAEASRIDQYSGLIATVRNATEQGLIVHLATRATCAEHLEHGDDNATETLTAAAFPASRIDEEKLARALKATGRVIVPQGYSTFAVGVSDGIHEVAKAYEAEP